MNSINHDHWYMIKMDRISRGVKSPGNDSTIEKIQEHILTISNLLKTYKSCPDIFKEVKADIKQIINGIQELGMLSGAP